MLTKLSQQGFSQPVLGDCCLSWRLNPGVFAPKPHSLCGWLFAFHLYGMAPHSSLAGRSFPDAFPSSRVSFWLAGPRLDPAAQALCRFPSKVPYLWLGDAGGILPAPLQANIYSEQMLHGFIRLAQKMQGRTWTAGSLQASPLAGLMVINHTKCWVFLCYLT